MHNKIFATVIIIIELMAGIQAENISVLWCGNSYTDAGHVFSMVCDMVNCDTCGVAEDVTLSVEPEFWAAANLQVHWVDRKAGERIDTGHFDYVLLQDMQGNVSWDGGRKQIFQYTDSFTTHIRRRGGESISFQNWVWASATEATWRYHKAFWDSLAYHFDNLIMPAGLAWWNSRKLQPNLEWFDPGWNDGNHPGRAGAYLNACVAFSLFTGVSPVGHKWRLIKSWANSYVEPATAQFLQEQAWLAYSEYYGSTKMRKAVVTQTPAAIPDFYSMIGSSIMLREGGAYRISVIDLLGKSVAEAKGVAQGPALISINDQLPKGFFSIRICQNGKVGYIKAAF